MYSFQEEPTDSTSLKMLKSDQLNYTVARNFSDVHWYPQKSVVQYNLTYNMTDGNNPPTSAQPSDSDEPTPNADATYKLPNLGALDTWNQISNKPKYMLAW